MENRTFQEDIAMSKGKIAALAAAVVMALISGPAFAEGDPKVGASVYKKRCLSCHPKEAGKHKMGPSIAAMFGRQAGTVPGFRKYKGLKGSKIVWDEANMDKWLANPKKFIGKKTSMVYKLKNAKHRADVIEYMKTLK